ncbi:MAG TPA: MFS transporter [Arachidicoccus sp.]|nr:MFS transporter [Arachidicoccus sp.]
MANLYTIKGADKSMRKRYSWTVVALLWVVAFLNYLDRILITSMRDPIVHDFSITDGQFGLLTAVFLWSYGMLSPFGGYFADKYSRKKVIIFSVLVWSLMTLWTGYAGSYEEMLISRVLMGVSEACYIPAALALITDFHRGRTRSLATGLHMSGLYAGLALGGVGGFIAERFGWRFGFHVFGVFGILYSLVLLFVLKDLPDRAAVDKTAKSNPTNTTITGMESEGILMEPAAGTDMDQPPKINMVLALKELFGQTSFIILLIYFAILGMVNWLVYGWLPTFLKHQYHLDLGTAGISATLYIQIGSFIGVVVGGILADRWARRNPKGRIYVLIIGFSLGAPFLFLMASTSVFYIAIIAMLIFGLARGFSDANHMPILRQIADNRYIATGYGFLNALGTIVGGGMVYVGGALRDAAINLAVIYEVAAVLLLVATWLLFRLKIKPDQS